MADDPNESRAASNDGPSFGSPQPKMPNARANSKQLTSLPEDIIHTIFHELHSFKELHALLLTSKVFSPIFYAAPNAICAAIARRSFPPEAFKVLDAQRPGGISREAREYADKQLRGEIPKGRDILLAQLLQSPELQEDPVLDPSPDVVGLMEAKRMLANERTLCQLSDRLTSTWTAERNRVITELQTYAGNLNPLERHRVVDQNGLISYDFNSWGSSRYYQPYPGYTPEAPHRMVVRNMSPRNLYFHSTGRFWPGDRKSLHRTLYLLISIIGSIHLLQSHTFHKRTITRLVVDLTPYTRLNYHILLRTTSLAHELMSTWQVWQQYFKYTACVWVHIRELEAARQRELRMFNFSGYQYGPDTRLPKGLPPGWGDGEIEEAEASDGKSILISNVWLAWQ